MPISLYNSLTHRIETFAPLDSNCVTVYLCGPTVYDYLHIGNARGPVVFDVLVALLRRHYPNVLYARNITDVEDKINAAALTEGVSIGTITRRYKDAYHEDMQRLNVTPPDLEPHATAHIKAIIRMNLTLIANGHAYISEGHVLFDVGSYPAYGVLSGHRTEELIAGARVEVAAYKKSPSDFVLWKPSTPEQPGWNSPWGRGRPGWHIECSAMCAAQLGQTIDIHGGGIDLLFPHHENEIAQSVCAHGGKTFARWWVHNGMLTFAGRKMSKSLGNVRTLHSLLAQHAPEAIRLLLLHGHYRQPLDWSDDSITQATSTLDGWYRILRDLVDVPNTDATLPVPEAMERALCDDLNTPQALAELASLARLARQQRTSEAKAALLGGGAMLGLLQQDINLWFGQSTDDRIDSACVEALLDERQAARAARDFNRADAIRHKLSAMGVLIEDSAQGTRWSVRKR